MSVYNCMRESWSDTQSVPVESVPVAGQRWAAVEEEGEGEEGGLACRGFRYLQI